MKTIQLKKFYVAKPLFAMLFALTLTFMSCDSDDENSNSSAYIPSSQAFKTLFSDALENITQTATFDAATNFSFHSEKGVLLTINGNCLRKNGNPVTGVVDLEFIEIFDRSTMLSTNKLTMGLETGERKLLTSGGEFYINATQDGVQLTLECEIFLSVPTSLTGGTDNTMLPFLGSIDVNGDLVWEESSSTESWIGTGQGVTGGSYPVYNALTDAFGWFNYDRFVNYPGLKTSITALVPQGYGDANNNSTVFFTTPDYPNSAGGIGGQFPIDLQVNIIFVTEQNGMFRYAIKPTTSLVANHQVTFTLAETILATEEEFIAAINALP